MKKIIVMLFVVSMVLMSCGGDINTSDIKTGYIIDAPHGHYAFGTAVVVMSGDTIISANLDEFQFQGASDDLIGVPNSFIEGEENYFGKGFAEGQVLVSKKIDSAVYSKNMSEKAGATVPIADNYAAIEAFVVGKTIAEIEGVANQDAKKVVDAVSGATLADTKGYLGMIIKAAKAAK
ncbi:hypothetical protein EXM22_13725 [Oceanispirochaeta crateris]|uniref:FMN-binding protein n=1 Tax=Oceanispirochaeta crateris TaxID=2518645 RepID=A0A5C1QR12_9SPIO|nr:hypothetical protein [Oceanispirochaeta crateris]QEN08996.1 hypothetical protein EXM22_13725 [Oceanispirochaeta crateris]